MAITIADLTSNVATVDGVVTGDGVFDEAYCTSNSLSCQSYLLAPD